MYNKQNENYGLYLAGLISENQYYELCEGKKHKKSNKKHMAKDVTGDGKADFADVMASRMIAGGMDKEEAIKKAHAIHSKHSKKKKKKKAKHCNYCMETTSPTKLGANLGITSGTLATKLEPLFSAMLELEPFDLRKILTLIKSHAETGHDLKLNAIKNAIDRIQKMKLDDEAKNQENQQNPIKP